MIKTLINITREWLKPYLTLIKPRKISISHFVGLIEDFKAAKMIREVHEAESDEQGWEIVSLMCNEQC